MHQQHEDKKQTKSNDDLTFQGHQGQIYTVEFPIYDFWLVYITKYGLA